MGGRDGDIGSAEGLESARDTARDLAQTDACLTSRREWPPFGIIIHAVGPSGTGT